LGGALRERTVVTKGERFSAVFALCHFKIPSWDCRSGVNRPGSYHRKD
jgi:hypothetical protein